jgi:serine/threonine protein kinase
MKDPNQPDLAVAADPDAVGPGRDFVTGEPTVDEQLLRQKLRARMFGTGDEAVRIGRYTVLDKLGEGGMGIVYRARDEELGRDVAIKVMAASADAARERLQREARAMARLSHPNVVTVHEVGSVEDQVYVAMELVPGTTLRRWLEAPHSRAERLDVFLQAAQGLEAAHEAGIVHRDFKPENVIVGDDGRVRVVDFGLATSPDEAAAVDGSPPLDPPAGAASLTHTGQRLGTPAYMAPEQFLGSAVDARSDQFSFCVALFEGLYEKRPFPGDTAEEIGRAVLGGRVTPAEDPWGSQALRDAIQRGLERDPASRNPSMAALVRVLEREPRPAPAAPLLPVPITPQVVPPGGRSRRGNIIAVMLVLGLVMFGANVAMFIRAKAGGHVPWVAISVLVALILFAIPPIILVTRRSRG